jgi:hypothetical protein
VELVAMGVDVGQWPSCWTVLDVVRDELAFKRGELDQRRISTARAEDRAGAGFEARPIPGAGRHAVGKMFGDMRCFAARSSA